MSIKIGLKLKNGGRLYWKEVAAGDKSGRVSRYEKIVDCNEVTITFVQKNIGY